MKDKVVIITGSTSGIGLAIAKRFARANAKLVISGLESEQVYLDQIINELKKEGAAEVFYVAANLTDPIKIDDMFKEIIAKFGKGDILINNACIQFVSAIEEFPPHKWEEVIKVGLIAPFYAMKYTIPLMKQNKWGRVINIASAHGLVASPFKSAYIAAKHGLIGLTKSAALEVAESGITINAICPGYVNTPLVMKQIADTARVRQISEEEVINKVILGVHATKKFVEVEEINEFIMFLCSSYASSITGAALAIDGGWTAH